MRPRRHRQCDPPVNATPAKAARVPSQEGRLVCVCVWGACTFRRVFVRRTVTLLRVRLRATVCVGARERVPGVPSCIGPAQLGPRCGGERQGQGAVRRAIDASLSSRHTLRDNSGVSGCTLRATSTWVCWQVVFGAHTSPQTLTPRCATSRRRTGGSRSRPPSSASSSAAGEPRPRRRAPWRRGSASWPQG